MGFARGDLHNPSSMAENALFCALINPLTSTDLIEMKATNVNAGACQFVWGKNILLVTNANQQ